MMKCLLILILFFNFAFAEYFHASISPIPPLIKTQMQKNTWRPGCPVPLSSLAYIKLTYWGFDDKTHQGVLIINNELAKEVVAIFRELYSQQFPLQSIEPVESFNGDDERSMNANNTSGFNCRNKIGSHVFSTHAYGRAIDINPLINPYINGDQVSPHNATPYINRKQNYPGMIEHNSFIYNIFKKHGWQWGGDWQSVKDYQHFEKTQTTQGS